MKVVINECYGGFNVSTEVLKELVRRNASCIVSYTLESYYGSKWKEYLIMYEDLGNEVLGHISGFNILKDGLLYSLDDSDKNSMRTNKDLVETVEALGDKANGISSKLKVVEIPSDIDWYITERYGAEKIVERHKSWA